MKRKLSSTMSSHLAALEASAAMTMEHVVAVMNNIRHLRHLLGRTHAECIWQQVGTVAALVLRHCSHMDWIPDVFAIVDVFCSYTLGFLQWNNSSPAFWQPLSDVHLQPLLQFCSEAMAHSTTKLAIGKASAIRSSSMLLIIAVNCLSRSWQRTKSNVVNRSNVAPVHGRVLVKACAQMCSCVHAARACSNMTLLISLVTSLSRVRLLLECVWTLVASALQLRSHVLVAHDAMDARGSNAAEAWAVSCTQTTSFLIILHAPVRADVIASLLFEAEALFSSLPCGASREEMLQSTTRYQRSALTLAHCLDFSGPMEGLKHIMSQGAGVSLQGRFRIMCTMFGLHTWALQPPPAEVCESFVGGSSGLWSMTLSPLLFCCSEHLSLLHRCAMATVSSACRVNVSLVTAALGPGVLRNLGLPPTAMVCREGTELDLPVVDVAVLCAIICCDGGCNWMFADEERLGDAFVALRRTLQFALSPSMAGGSLTKIVIHAFAVFVTVILDIIASASVTLRSRELLRSSLQLPTVERSSVQWMKHASVIEKVDRQLGTLLATCIRAMRSSPSALGDTEVCVLSNALMTTRDAGSNCLSIVNSAWPLLGCMVWRASLDTIQFVESLSDISCGLEEKRPSNVMGVGVPCMGIVIACIVLEARDSNLTAMTTVADDSNQTPVIHPLQTVRQMFPVDLNPISYSSQHVAPYVRALMGKGNTRVPTIILLSQAAGEAVSEALQLLPVQEQLREAADADIHVSDLFGEVAIVFTKLPGLLQFVLSRVVRKLGIHHSDAAAEVCKRALGTVIMLSCEEWSKCNSMASQVIGALAMHAIVQAIVTDADADSGAYAMHQLPPLQMPPELRTEAENKIVAKERPNMKVRLQARVAAAAVAVTGAGSALTLQAHSAMNLKREFGRERMFKMLLKIFPEISPHQQQLKIVALSCVRDAWIGRALLPLWVSVRVLKSQASGKGSRRRASSMSDRGLLPALLQVRAVSASRPFFLPTRATATC